MNTLGDAQVGDVVIIYCSLRPDGRLEVLANNSYRSVAVLADVLRQRSAYNETTLGWKPGQPQPKGMSDPIDPLWANLGYTEVQTYGSHCECQIAAKAKPIAMATPKKKKYTTECPCGIHPSQCEYHR
jgi:hypothetical protein